MEEFAKSTLRSLSTARDPAMTMRGESMEPLPQREPKEKYYPRAASTLICKRRELEEFKEPIRSEKSLELGAPMDRNNQEFGITADGANIAEPEVTLRVGSTPIQMSESFGAALPSSDDSRSFASMMDLDTSVKSRKRKSSTSPKGPQSSGDEDTPIKWANRKRKSGRIIRDDSMSKSPTLPSTQVANISVRNEANNLEVEGNRSSDDLNRRFAATDIVELGDRIHIWLQEVDKLRGKSRNLQGKVSGEMKQKLRYSMLAVKDVVQRSNPSEDATLLRMRNSELAAELREACR